MAYLEISDFRAGLDARKSQLSSPAGTLTDAINGHITQGGEIEKRKAFIRFCATGILDTNGDAGVFGFQSLATTMVVFGSALPHGGSVTLGQPTLVSAIPSTSPAIVYQQLQHPAVIDGATYDRTLHRMTAILCSEQFGGKAFASAEFADGSTFAYYDGSIIPAWANGLVLQGLTSYNSLATEMAAALSANLSGYTVEHTPGNAYVDLKAPISGTYALTPGEVSAAGLLAVGQISPGVGPTEGNGASTNVTFTGGTSGSITSVLAPDGLGGTVELLTFGPIAYSTSLANTAALLATSITNGDTSPKYTAVAVSNVVTISAPASLGATVNALNVVLTFSGTLTFDSSGVVALTATFSPSYLQGQKNSPSSVTVYTTTPSSVAVCTPSGGVAPYTYAWEVDNCVADTPTASSTRFHSIDPVPPSTDIGATARCKVTDSSLPVQTAYTPYIGITLSNIFDPTGGR